jgi:hypothetical protein
MKYLSHACFPLPLFSPRTPFFSLSPFPAEISSRVFSVLKKAPETRLFITLNHVKKSSHWKGGERDGRGAWGEGRESGGKLSGCKLFMLRKTTHE